MTEQPLPAEPTVADLEGIDCPVQVAAVITRVSRQRGTLSPQLAQRRKEAIHEARQQRNPDGTRREVTAIAREIGLSQPRVSQLLKTN